ncbi:MAG: DUF4388 domain-containing protein [Acidobacteria bacterium]|nr:DUF4388 domain-containing protein [Acidobacteriota bacterium]
MTTTVPKRFEPFVVPGGLKGQLSQLPLPEILQHLRLAQATGILTLVSGGARKALYIKDGRVVFASSNLPNDRLGEILLREGKITVEEYEDSIKAISKGKRQGKVLVEMGALSPKDLWEGVQFQVKEIVYSTFQWDEGQFHFEESTLPEKERITVDLDLLDLILVGIRRVDAGGPLQTRYPDGDLLLERLTGPPPAALEPYELHVLNLVDGERSVLEICRESEIGDNETLKVLYALLCTGVARVKGKKVYTLDQDFVPEDSLHSVAGSFNQMYGYVFRYMVREVGPIAENVLEKYLGGLRESRKDVFATVRLQKDGTIDSTILERNMNRFPEEQRRGLLVDGLNELLYAELLAVKRTLGAEHEAAIVKALKDR